MIDAEAFCNSLKKAGYKFITGVPDSLLKELTYSFEYFYKKQHIISTNEGSAVALAIGNYLGTKTPGVVYLQNSGLGNIINPITSLANSKAESFVKFTNPAFAGGYAGPPPPPNACTEEIFKILPEGDFFNKGAKYLVIKNGPFKFTPITVSQSLRDNF